MNSFPRLVSTFDAWTRRDFCRIFGAGIGAGLGAAFGADAGAAGDFPKLSKGISLHHLLNWPDTKPGNGKTQYVWPPFEAANYKITDAELNRLKAMGFDFLRVTADPSILLASDKVRLGQLTKIVQATCQRLIDAGFSVIFDLHPVSVNPEYDPLKLVENIKSPVFQSYANLVEHLARVFHGMDHRKFAFELMNEPWLSSASEVARWQEMQELLHSRARKGSATLPLVLTGAQWGDAKALMQLDLKPFQGSNVLYTFHYYDPHTFTHQGVEGDEGEYLSGLLWPVSRENIAKVKAQAFQRIEASKKKPAEVKQIKAVTDKLLADYELTAHDRSRIRSDFEAVAKWAGRSGIPVQRIFLGEFGCVASPHKIALGAERVEWLKAIRETATEFGFPWALWAYKGYGGMALFEDGKLDEGLAGALALPF